MPLLGEGIGLLGGGTRGVGATSGFPCSIVGGGSGRLKARVRRLCMVCGPGRRFSIVTGKCLVWRYRYMRDRVCTFAKP